MSLTYCPSCRSRLADYTRIVFCVNPRCADPYYVDYDSSPDPEKTEAFSVPPQVARGRRTLFEACEDWIYAKSWRVAGAIALSLVASLAIAYQVVSALKGLEGILLSLRALA